MYADSLPGITTQVANPGGAQHNVGMGLPKPQTERRKQSEPVRAGICDSVIFASRPGLDDAASAARVGDLGHGPHRLSQYATILLTAWMASCTPAVTRHDLQRADAPPDSARRDDLELLKSARYRSVRGAAADELPGSALHRARAIANALATDYIRRREGPLYRRRDGSPATDGLPQLCVALSGGGMRALSFDAGVLYGLERAGLYGKVNVISAASGGGFASYWAIGSVARASTEAEVFSGPHSAALTRLRDHGSDLASLWSRAQLAAGVAQSDVQWQFNVQRSREQILGVDASVQIVAGPGHWAYSAALDQMLLGLHENELRELVSSGRVPVPVWLAAARPARDPLCIGPSPDRETVERSRSILFSAFELGPTRMGSEELGFITHALLPPIDAITVSGAAMSLPFNQHCQLLHTIDASIRITNFPAPRAPGAPATVSQASLPKDETFDLEDGGLADNLALFPLVRRLCSEIIIVDAGFDPYLAFDDYQYLKQQLARLDIEIVIPELDAIVARNRLPDSQVPCRDGVCLVRPRPECIRRERRAGCVASDEVPNAVFDGAIRAIPLASRTADDAEPWSVGERALHVRYIKLSLDGTRIDRYPATVRTRFAVDVAQRRAVTSAVMCIAAVNTGACSFPHLATIDVDYRGDKFAAYWDLGRCIMEQDWNAAGKAPTGRCSESDWAQ